MKKLILVSLILMAIVGFSQFVHSNEPELSKEYILYFEDDFSGEDKFWINSQCSTAYERNSRCFTDEEPEMEAECGVDSETETFREKYIDIPTCGFSNYNFLYEDAEYGDKIEFDFIVAQHESGRPICGMEMSEFYNETLFSEEGTYHIEGKFDRDYFRLKMTYPNGDVQEIDILTEAQSSATIKDLITQMRIPAIPDNEGCAVDNRIDNLKIYKQRDSLGHKILVLWNRVF